MTIIALISGLIGLLAGIAKYSLDAYRAKRSPPSVVVSIGDDSIELPETYTPDQVAAVIAALKATPAKQ